MARYLDIHPVDPQPRLIEQAVHLLREGGLIAYPTDSGYALGCALEAHDALESIRRIRQVGADHDFTLVCADFAQLSQFVIVSNPTFRLIKSTTPGPYTFILKATKEVPRRMAHPRKKTVGVRIPDHRTARALVQALGEPIVSSTLILPGEQSPLTEGWVVQQHLDDQLAAIIDAGPTPAEPTSVLDLTGDVAEIRREGAGDLSMLG